MKPLSGDHRHRLLITGDELRELKRHTWAMAEAFGLDRKIEKYQGTRPLTLYRWDLDCLMDVIDVALGDYTDQLAPGYLALKNLGERLHQEYDSVYGKRESPPSLGKTKSVTRLGRRKAVIGKSSEQQDSVYQLKIKLMDIQPSIWRRVEAVDCTLLRLHKIIQVCMGWKNRHAWALVIDGKEYGDDVIDSGGDREFASARKTKLSQFVNQGIERFLYVYDLGDNWQHVIQVEKVLEADPHVKYPRCIQGGRACPPEECGGPWGYEKFLNIIPFPDHEQHEDMMALVDGEFDSEAFDIGAVNKELQKVR